MADTDVLERLRSHRFPGGTYRIAHWENFLLTDCTGRAPLPGDLAHPVVLFHAPILGAGTSITELFEVGEASGAGSVGLEGYDWQYFQPLREEVDYRVTGGITSAARHVGSSGPPFDRVSFTIDLADPGGAPVAQVCNTWRFRRADADPDAPGVTPPPRSIRGAQDEPRTTGTDPLVGLVVPEWSVTVGADRMKTMAAILRDPYPVHWDVAAVQASGLGDRVINQGPLNLGYIANMLMTWAGDDAIRRLHVSFPVRVHDGDRVTARARVVDVAAVDGETIATCAVELVIVTDDADPVVAVRGLAAVALA